MSGFHFDDIPFDKHRGEDGEQPEIEDLVNIALDYIVERARIDEIYDYSEADLELVRTSILELIPDVLNPSQTWLLVTVITAAFNYRQSHNMPERIDKAVQAFKEALGPANADVKLVQVDKDSDDPLARLLAGMPEDPNMN